MIFLHIVPNRHQKCQLLCKSGKMASCILIRAILAKHPKTVIGEKKIYIFKSRAF